jgi:hypothetical protein
MNLGIIESRLLPAVERAIAGRAGVRAGPPLLSSVTGLKFDVWVHAARFEDFGVVTADGAVIARRPVEFEPNLSGFAEERPGRITIEITCTGPNLGQVQAICGDVPPEVLIELETMPYPALSTSPDESVILRFADFNPAVGSATFSSHGDGDAFYYVGVVTFRLDGFLHVTVTRPNGVSRTPAQTRRALSALVLKAVQGPVGADVTGEYVVITNTGAETVRLDGFALRDSAPKRPHRFTIPPFALAPGASVRVWTRKGKNDGGNLYWGRQKSVWNGPGDTITLLDSNGDTLAQSTYRKQKFQRGVNRSMVL